MTDEIREAFEAWIRKTDLIGVSWPNTYFIQWLNEAYLAGAAWQKQQCEAEIAEQCRIIGMSGERELDHLAEIARLREALLDMVWQFCSNGERLSHSFMSAEELAFSVLNLENGMTYEQAVKGSDDGRS